MDPETKLVGFQASELVPLKTVGLGQTPIIGDFHPMIVSLGIIGCHWWSVNVLPKGMVMDFNCDRPSSRMFTRLRGFLTHRCIAMCSFGIASSIQE